MTLSTHGCNCNTLVLVFSGLPAESNLAVVHYNLCKKACEQIKVDFFQATSTILPWHELLYFHIGLSINFSHLLLLS